MSYTHEEQPRLFRSKRLAWVEHFVLLALIAAFAVKAFIPAWRHLNTDFPNYYLVARLYRTGYPLERVYDWTWLQRQKDHLGIEQGLVSFIPSTLPSALAVLPWCSLAPLEAKHYWLLVNLVFLVLTAFLLTRVTKLGWERVALLIFLAFLPLRNNFLYGQMHLAVLLLLTTAAWLFFRDSQFLAGISLAMAAALKIYPALFFIYFAWKRQWRAALGLMLGVLGAAVMSLYLFGKNACALYVRQVLPAGLRGETIDPYHPAWNSWNALVRRLFIAEPELNPAPVAHLPWLYAFLQPLIHSLILVVFMWAIGSRKCDPERTKIEWATFVFFLLFLSSQPGSYHFVALILSGALVVDYLFAHQQTIQLGVAVAIYALIGAPIVRFPLVTPTGWQNLLFFSRLGWMTLFGGLLLWILLPRLGQSFFVHFNFKSAVIALCILVALTAVGFVSTERHLHGQYENYNARVGTDPENALSSDPAVTASAILFTKMIRTGYTVRRLPDGTDADFAPSGSDWFHPTASEQTGSIWAEQSVRNGSRIVRFAIDARGKAIAAGIEVEGAQEPVVSRDGQLLAFLRTVNGRNSLWTQRVGTPVGVHEANEAREIAGEDYDVLEASFLPDHRMIFSSKRNGRVGLYIATQSGIVEEFKKPVCPARYPAISPDGRWMAFTCEEREDLQIHVIDLEGNEDLQLTSGDCNSKSPAWTADSKRIVYATDCGRGLGLTALAEVTVFH
jgi:hypothetical protein